MAAGERALPRPPRESTRRKVKGRIDGGREVPGLRPGPPPPKKNMTDHNLRTRTKNQVISPLASLMKWLDPKENENTVIHKASEKKERDGAT